MYYMWCVWILLLQRLSSTYSGRPPIITDFLAYDLTQPGDVTSHLGFRLPCAASGTGPLQYRWKLNGTDISHDDHNRLLPTGTLEGGDLDHNNDGTYQCFVKNDFGEDFSRKMWVKVSALGDFYYEDDKVARVILGKPIEIHCPSHEPSYGVTYRWGGFSSADSDVFRPFPEDERVAVTPEGTLVIMSVTINDVQQVNSTGGIFCEMAMDKNATYSHTVDFYVHGNEFKGNKTPEIYFAPKSKEEATEGTEKKLYCLAVAKPPPFITWTKDGETIEDGKDEFYLPTEHFNRLLIITNVSKKHEGIYTCTASSSHGNFMEKSKTILTVKAAPKWKLALPPRTQAEISKTKLLRCLAAADPTPRYRWFRNGREISKTNSRLKVRENVLELTNVESWHDAVYQCVAENRLGMNVTSTWVEVQVPGGSSDRESSGAKLWYIIAAVLGVLLITTLVVLLICYRRRKARGNEETSRSTEEASRYNEIFDENKSNQSLPRAQTVPTGPQSLNGMHRRPTLPPLPQYQSLDPSTIGPGCYEPLGPQQDLNDSGVYERLDFRTLDETYNYDNPGKGKPIPEYLELVSDTNTPPGDTASTRIGTECYEPMDSGQPGHMVHADQPMPSYEQMDIEVSNVKKPLQRALSSPKYYECMATDLADATNSSPTSPRYYEPMAANSLNETTSETNDSPLSTEYYQPMANNVSFENVSPLPQEYYVPMAKNSPGNSESQKKPALTECSQEEADDGQSTTL